jgi:hypothetical protein
MVAINQHTKPKPLTIAEMAARGKALMEGKQETVKIKPTTTALPAEIIRACTFFGFGGTLEWVTPDVLSLIYVDLLRVYHPDCGGTQLEMDQLVKYKKILDTIAR